MDSLEQMIVKLRESRTNPSLIPHALAQCHSISHLLKSPFDYLSVIDIDGSSGTGPNVGGQQESELSQKVKQMLNPAVAQVKLPVHDRLLRLFREHCMNSPMAGMTFAGAQATDVVQFHLHFQLALCRITLLLLQLRYSADIPEQYSELIADFMLRLENDSNGTSAWATENVLARLGTLKRDLLSVVLESKLGAPEAEKYADQQKMTLYGAYKREHSIDIHCLVQTLYEQRVVVSRILALIYWNSRVEPPHVQALLKYLLSFGAKSQNSGTDEDWEGVWAREPCWILLACAWVSQVDFHCELSLAELTRQPGNTQQNQPSKWLDETRSLIQTAFGTLFKTQGMSTMESALGLLLLSATRKFADKWPGLTVSEEGKSFVLGQATKQEEWVDRAILAGGLAALRRWAAGMAVESGDEVYYENMDAARYALITMDVFDRTPHDWARALVVSQFERLVVFFVSRMGDLIRRLKLRDEEPSISASAEAGNRRFYRSQLHDARSLQDISGSQDLSQTPQQRRKDVQTLLEFISVVYSGRPNAALELLDPRRRGFLKIMYDDRLSMGAKRAYFDMLSALATGSQTAQMVYDLLAGFASSLSWDWILGGLDWYANEYTQMAERGIQPDLDSMDLALLMSMTRVLKMVVKYSPTARLTLYDQGNALKRVVNLLSTRLPKELKAALFGCMSAFGLSEGLSENYHGIPAQIWQVLEHMAVLPPSGLSGAGSITISKLGSARAQVSGIIYDLEMIESKDQAYPETRAFLGLLNTLVYPFSQPPSYAVPVLAPYGLRPVSTNAISVALPESLVQLSQQGSTVMNKYVEYVLSDVLLKIRQRGFGWVSEKWSLMSSCTEFLERCVFGFDVEEMLRDLERAVHKVTVANQGLPAVDSGRVSPFGYSQRDSTKDAVTPDQALSHAMRRIVGHPGFVIFCSLYSGTRVLEELFYLVSQPAESINKSQSKHYVTCVLRGLRILLRALDVQDIFLHRIIPLLRRYADSAVKQVDVPGSMAPLDEFLASRPQTVVKIVELVNCNVSEEIVFLSVRLLSVFANSLILTHLSARFGLDNQMRQAGVSEAPNHLVQILVQSESFLKIVSGFVNRMASEDVWDSGLSSSLENAGAHAILLQLKMDTEDDPMAEASLTNAIRLAIVDLMMRNLQQNPGRPTIAHVLLGYNVRGTSGLSMTQFQRREDWGVDQTKTCFYALIDIIKQDLAQVESETETPLRLRQPELMVRVLEVMHSLASDGATSSPTMRYLRYGEHYFAKQIQVLGEEIYGANNWAANAEMQGDQVPASTVISQLHYRAWALKLIALEVHLSAFNNEKRHGLRLADDLFDLKGEERFEIGTDSIVVHLLHHICSISPMSRVTPDGDISFKYFGHIPIDQCRFVDENGCEIFDLRLLYSLLSESLTKLKANSAIRSSQALEEAKQEMDAILLRYVTLNDVNLMLFARSHAIKAWRDLVLCTLQYLYPDIPCGVRETMLLNLMSFMLPILNQDDLMAQDKLCFCEVAVALFAQLKEDRRVFEVIRRRGLAVDPLLGAFQEMLGCIIDKNTDVAIRGNLYGAILDYFGFCQIEKRPVHAVRTTDDDTMSLKSVSTEVTSFSTSGRPKKDHHSKVLQQGNLACLNQIMDSLLPVVTQDASMQGVDVWRTIALAFLNALISHQGERVIEFLRKRNLIRHFVSELKAFDDPTLCGILDNVSEESTSPVFIYESKMSLLLKLAQSATGAMYLVDSLVFETLTDLKFLKHRLDSSMMSDDSETWNQIARPVLQLVSTVLASLGSDNTSACKKAAVLVQNQFVFFTGCLRSNDSIQIKNASSIMWFLAPFSEVMNKNAPESLQVALLSILPSSLDRIDINDHLHFDLIQNVLAYCERVSLVGGISSKLRSPCFSSHLSEQVFAREKSRQPLPSLGILVGYLRSFVAAIDIGQKFILHTQDTLQDPSEYLTEEMMLELNLPAGADDLEQEERRLLVEMELQKRIARQKALIKRTLASIEMILVILYRHTEYYMSQQQEKPELVERLQSDAMALLQPQLDKIESMKLDAALLGFSSTTARSHENFNKMLTRKIQESLSFGSAMSAK